jgi:hypothetical protein
VSPLAIVFVILNAGALLCLPRRWAALPLITGTCFITMAQTLNVGPFSFTVVRLLVAAGAVRVLLRQERLPHGLLALDRLMILWAIWACSSSVFHTDPKSHLTGLLGKGYDACGIYFLFRIFCSDIQDLVRLVKLTAIVLTPVAIAMLAEHIVGHNWFAIFGGVSDSPMVRDNRIRASGPFMHPILAGTVGAVNLPLAIALWRFHRLFSCLGVVACCAMVLASNSSGPIMTAAFSLCGLTFWLYRNKMYLVRRAAIVAYVVLEITMKAPAYYVIARIDLTGSSTGWHRAALIEAALTHLDEWWLAGTDYTRHWIASGVSWSPNHTDITNHYLQMGVEAGLPLILLFLMALARAFRYVGNGIRQPVEPNTAFVRWSVGVALFAHCATFLSVSYFDQSILFIYSVLAAAASTAPPRRTLPTARATHVTALPPLWRSAIASR